MSDQFSKRKIIISKEESETIPFEDIPHQTSEELFYDDDYGVEDLISDLESTSFDDGDEMDEVDFSVSSNESNMDNLGFESSSKEGIQYETEDFVNYLESEESQDLEPIIPNDDLDFTPNEDNDNLEEKGLVFKINELEIKNKSIKLDLWLKQCVNSEFINTFLKYKNFTIDNIESPISAIISSFELDEILEFKYKHNVADFKNVLMKFFLPIGVINLVDIAKKYGVSISLTKDGLIKNFLEIYTPYELIKILDQEGLDIVPFLDIPVLEQIYLLNDSKLEEISKKLCPYEDSAKIGMMSCIVKYYDERFLLSHNKLEGVNK